MPWTNVAKPTGTGYTKPSRLGFIMYNDPSYTYSTTLMTYNGKDPKDFVKVAKPTGSSWTSISKPV